MHPPAHRAGPPAPQSYYHAPMNMAYAAIPIPPPPTLQQKRTSESVEEDQGGPKAKKARATKAKAADSTGSFPRSILLVSDINTRIAPSRRGAKKRGDSSQMSTQNGESGRRFVCA